MDEVPSTQTAPNRWMPALLCAGVLLATIWAAGLGELGGPASIVTAVYLLLTASVFPLLYLAGSIGLGVPLQRIFAPGARRLWTIRAGLGLAAMLTLTQLLGMTGLLFVRPVALGLPLVGVGLLIHRLSRHKAELRLSSPSLVWLSAVPAIGVLFAAASSPPGWLWSSEIGGYDVLSYHLQLPSDWIAMGSVWPVEHNVYSYLPGYIEAAFTHTAVALGASDQNAGILTGDIVFACQFLHAWIAILAGVLSASACSALCERLGISSKLATIAGAIAGAVVLATPWSVVTGSMAYNEMGVVLFFAAAVVAALEDSLKPAQRGLVAGLLVGAACGCKPTALLFVAPAVGLILVWISPRRFWITLTCTACAGGLAMLLPWLVRNAMAGGNPVFPQLAGVFGSAHWTDAQIQRYATAHSFNGSVLEALRLLVLPDAGDPAATSGSPIHRGLMHRQWSLMLPMSVVSLVVIGLGQNTRKLLLPALIVLVLQLLAWLLLTHIQSRFLIPLILPMACVIAISIAATIGDRIRLLASAGAGAAAALVLSVSTVLAFSAEGTRGGGPNAATTFGTAQFTTAPADLESAQDLTAVQFLNSQLEPNARVLSLGSATPLYTTCDLVYTTTWDTSPLVSVMHEFPGEPASWSARLSELGYTHVFVDLGELARLTGSNWTDPLLNPTVIAQWLTDTALPIYKSEHAPQLIYELP